MDNELESPIVDEVAVAYLKRKDAIPTWLNSRQIVSYWDHDAKAKTFFSAKVMSADLLAGIRRRVEQVVAGEMSTSQASAWITDFLKTDGASEMSRLGFLPANESDNIAELGSVRRINLIIETQVRMAQAAGERQSNLDIIDTYPYQQYHAYPDARPGHAELNGRIYHLKDPVWSRITPPWDYNCRCYVTTMTRKKAEAAGVSDSLPSGWAPPESGFSFDPDIGLSDIQQPKPAWDNPLTSDYVNAVTPVINSEIDHLTERKAFWSKKLAEGEPRALEAVEAAEKRLDNLRRERAELQAALDRTQEEPPATPNAAPATPDVAVSPTVATTVEQAQANADAYFPKLHPAKQADVVAVAKDRAQGVNKALLGDAPMTPDVERVKESVSAALKPAPKFSGPVWSGNGFEDEAKLERFLSGLRSTVGNPGFTAGSLSEAEARDAMEGLPVKLLMKIASRSGVPLGSLSPEGLKGSVLFDAGLRLAVVNLIAQGGMLTGEFDEL